MHVGGSSSQSVRVMCRDRGASEPNQSGIWQALELLTNHQQGQIDKLLARVEELEEQLRRVADEGSKRSNHRRMPHAGNAKAFDALAEGERTKAVRDRKKKQDRRKRRAYAIALLNDEVEIKQELYLKVHGLIEEGTATSFVKELTNNPHAKRVTVEINSEGGCLNSAKVMADALTDHSAAVSTHASGECSSAAITLFLAGRHRTTDNQCSFLFHKPYFDGEKENSPEREGALNRVTEELIENYTNKTGKPSWWFSRLMTKYGYRLNAQVAKSYGIATDVVGRNLVTQQPLAA